MAAAGTLGRSADEYGNDSRVETLWAMKAMEQAEVYFNVSAPYILFDGTDQSSPNPIYRSKY